MPIYKRVRVRATVDTQRYPQGYRVNYSDGAHCWCDSLDQARKEAEWFNNPDSDGHYMTVRDYEAEARIAQEEEEAEEARLNYLRKVWKEKAQAREKRIADEENRVNKKRKDKTVNDKYVYVISFVLRDRRSTSYFKGETDLAKMVGNRGENNFYTDDVSEAKIYKTAAEAQKLVDKLNKAWIVNHILRNLKAVRKQSKDFRQN